MYYAITNLRDARGLAAKMRRWSSRESGYACCIWQRGSTVVVEKEHKPWAELSGHMTNNTEIYPCKNFSTASEYKQ